MGERRETNRGEYNCGILLGYCQIKDVFKRICSLLMCFKYLLHFHKCQRIITLGHVIRESVVKPRRHWEYCLLSGSLIDTCLDDLIVYTASGCVI